MNRPLVGMSELIGGDIHVRKLYPTFFINSQLSSALHIGH